MFANTFAGRRVMRSLTEAAACSAVTLVATGTIAFGAGVAGAPVAFADNPVPVPPPAPAAAAPGAGASMGNSFLQMLSSMLDRVVPGAGHIIPSTLPGQPIPGGPAQVAPQLFVPPGQSLA